MQKTTYLNLIFKFRFERKKQNNNRMYFMNIQLQLNIKFQSF